MQRVYPLIVKWEEEWQSLEEQAAAFSASPASPFDSRMKLILVTKAAFLRECIDELTELVRSLEGTDTYDDLDCVRRSI